jgi:phosphatidylethanolamine/phosphatidyl-N-methylethanolamine N-methyltransferase
VPDTVSVSAAYDRYAQVYDRLFGWVLQDGRVQLAKRMACRPGEQVVEFGVGSGLMLPLYPPTAKVLGLDLSAGMLERARLRLVRDGLCHVTLRLIDAEHNGLSDACADHVVLPYVYSVTPQPLALMAEAFRVCKPGGDIWLLNHFSGLGVWDWLERPLKPFARWVGFRPDFPYQHFVTAQNWPVQAVYRANLLGLSRLVHIRKPT